MKITFVNLPLNFLQRWQGNTSIYAPLGICSLAAVLRDLGKHEVSIIDCVALGLDKEGLRKKLLDLRPEMIGLACSATLLLPMTREVSVLIKEIDPKILVVVGGLQATNNYKSMLEEEPCIDYILRGEAEFTLLALVNALEQKQSFKKIQGLAYRENGVVVATQEAKQLQDLDKLPFPALDLLPDINLYSTGGFKYKRKPMTSFVSSRGCPHSCLFCTQRKTGYRAHSPEYVVSYLQFLSEKLGVKEVSFMDDNFTLLNKRVEKICDLLIEKKVDITWSCLATIAGLSGLSVIEKMAKAGFWYIAFGLESGDVEVLKKNEVSKIQNLENVRRVLKECQKRGITTKGYFIIGLPGDTKKSIGKTIKFAKSLALDTVQFSFPIPYPGTEFYRVALESGGDFAKTDYQNMSSHAEFPVFAPQGITREWLKKKQRAAYRAFYFRPSYILKSLKKIDSFSTLKRYIVMSHIYFKKTVLEPFYNS